MGGGYSDLNVYFTSKLKFQKGDGYRVKTTQEIFKGCSDFEVITHNIEFTKPSDVLNYNVLLYDGTSEYSKGTRVFGYYYPSNEKEVIRQVSTYYSVLLPGSPLVISLKTMTNTYNCYFHLLKKAQWDYASNITEYSFGEPLEKKHLIEIFNNLSLNRTIIFKIGSKNDHVSCTRQGIGLLTFRYILTPDGRESIVGSESISTIDIESTTKSDVNNIIDPYYLKPFNGLVYGGIIIYFVKGDGNYVMRNGKDTAILLEFIYTFKPKTWLKRMDKQGYWWSRDKINYKDDDSLVKVLQQIQSGLTSVNTIILDKRSKYEGVKKIDSTQKKSYNKYKYTFDKEQKPVFLFEREQKTIGNLDDKNTKNVEVFYLKTNSGEDKEPFLIVIYENGIENQDKKKCYHFNDEYQFKSWQELGNEVKLDEKLRIIDDYASCIPKLSVLRWYTYTILTDKTIPSPDEAEEETHSRPPTKKPPDQPDGLPIPWIVAGSVGGGVFVISSAALYGVYWYNTTIKLLT